MSLIVSVLFILGEENLSSNNNYSICHIFCMNNIIILVVAVSTTLAKEAAK